MRGCFLTIEGGEGAGKSTQARLLAAALARRGLAVLRTREPGGAPGAERLRALLLDPAAEWSSRAEIFLHFAARAEHIAQTIRPALEAGMWVVCDRFYDSTLAYQGYGQGGDRGLISELSRLLDFTPDLTFVLDIDDSTARQRLIARGLPADRYERQDTLFHARVRAGFADIAAAHPERCVALSAAGDVQAVHAAMLAALARLTPLPPPP
jgi:dTMP kinase